MDSFRTPESLSVSMHAGNVSPLSRTRLASPSSTNTGWQTTGTLISSPVWCSPVESLSLDAASFSENIGRQISDIERYERHLKKKVERRRTREQQTLQSLDESVERRVSQNSQASFTDERLLLTRKYEEAKKDCEEATLTLETIRRYVEDLLQECAEDGCQKPSIWRMISTLVEKGRALEADSSRLAQEMKDLQARKEELSLEREQLGKLRRRILDQQEHLDKQRIAVEDEYKNLSVLQSETTVTTPDIHVSSPNYGFTAVVDIQQTTNKENNIHDTSLQTTSSLQDIQQNKNGLSRGEIEAETPAKEASSAQSIAIGPGQHEKVCALPLLVEERLQEERTRITEDLVNFVVEYLQGINKTDDRRPGADEPIEGEDEKAEGGTTVHSSARLQDAIDAVLHKLRNSQAQAIKEMHAAKLESESTQRKLEHSVTARELTVHELSGAKEKLLAVEHQLREKAEQLERVVAEKDQIDNECQVYRGRLESWRKDIENHLARQASLEHDYGKVVADVAELKRLCASEKYRADTVFIEKETLNTEMRKLLAKLSAQESIMTRQKQLGNDAIAELYQTREELRNLRQESCKLEEERCHVLDQLKTEQKRAKRYMDLASQARIQARQLRKRKSRLLQDVLKQKRMVKYSKMKLLVAVAARSRVESEHVAAIQVKEEEVATTKEELAVQQKRVCKEQERRMLAVEDMCSQCNRIECQVLESIDYQRRMESPQKKSEEVQLLSTDLQRNEIQSEMNAFEIRKATNIVESQAEELERQLKEAEKHLLAADQVETNKKKAVEAAREEAKLEFVEERQRLLRRIEQWKEAAHTEQKLSQERNKKLSDQIEDVLRTLDRSEQQKTAMTMEIQANYQRIRELESSKETESHFAQTAAATVECEAHAKIARLQEIVSSQHRQLGTKQDEIRQLTEAYTKIQKDASILENELSSRAGELRMAFATKEKLEISLAALENSIEAERQIEKGGIHNRCERIRLKLDEKAVQVSEALPEMKNIEVSPRYLAWMESKRQLEIENETLRNSVNTVIAEHAVAEIKVQQVEEENKRLRSQIQEVLLSHSPVLYSREKVSSTESMRTSLDNMKHMSFAMPRQYTPVLNSARVEDDEWDFCDLRLDLEELPLPAAFDSPNCIRHWHLDQIRRIAKKWSLVALLVLKRSDIRIRALLRLLLTSPTLRWQSILYQLVLHTLMALFLVYLLFSVVGGYLRQIDASDGT